MSSPPDPRQLQTPAAASRSATSATRCRQITSLRHSPDRPNPAPRPNPPHSSRRRRILVTSRTSPEPPHPCYLLTRLTHRGRHTKGQGQGRVHGGAAAVARPVRRRVPARRPAVLAENLPDGRHCRLCLRCHGMEAWPATREDQLPEIESRQAAELVESPVTIESTPIKSATHIVV